MKLNKLKRFRSEMGLNQDALAEKLRALPAFKKVTKNTISRWESGKYPMPLVKWAQVLVALGKPYEPMYDVTEKSVGEDEPVTETAAVSALRALVSEFTAGAGLPHCCKDGVRVVGLLGVDNPTEFQAALTTVENSGRTVHLPSFERGWLAALAFIRGSTAEII